MAVQCMLPNGWQRNTRVDNGQDSSGQQGAFPYFCVSCGEGGKLCYAYLGLIDAACRRWRIQYREEQCVNEDTNQDATTGVLMKSNSYGSSAVV